MDYGKIERLEEKPNPSNHHERHHHESIEIYSDLLVPVLTLNSFP